MKTIRVTNISLTLDIDETVFNKAKGSNEVIQLLENILNDLDNELQVKNFNSVSYVSLNNISDLNSEDIEVFNQDESEVTYE